jgi:hypothetical protein
VNEQGLIGEEAASDLKEKIDDVFDIAGIRLGALFLKKQ